jgi:hypothetical protein
MKPRYHKSNTRQQPPERSSKLEGTPDAYSNEILHAPPQYGGHECLESGPLTYLENNRMEAKGIEDLGPWTGQPGAALRHEQSVSSIAGTQAHASAHGGQVGMYSM